MERVQREACAKYGCNPTKTKGPQVDGVTQMYFAHDAWCGFVGGSGQ